LLNQALSFAGPYQTYAGSPVSRGILQHDMWGVKVPSDRWDWESLRADIAAHGVRNSLLLAPMPTASTSQVIAAFYSLLLNRPGRKTGPALSPRSVVFTQTL
jgi:hypothetical protein